MATVNKRGDSWQLNWSEGGRQRRQSLGQITAGEAEACRLAKELELQTGKRIFVAAPLFEEFLREYLDWHALKFPDSHARVKQICEQCFTEFLLRPISEIQQVDIEKWLAQRETRMVRNRHKQLAIAAAETATKELRTGCREPFDPNKRWRW